MNCYADMKRALQMSSARDRNRFLSVHALKINALKTLLFALLREL